jgi:DHA2 family multidrug resistance protein
MMPLNQASMASVTREESGDAAGIYNMARNLGGSVGLALIGIVIDRRNTLHVERLSETLNANSPLLQDRLAANAAHYMAQAGDAAYAQMQAIKSLVMQIHVQASVMTYSETFYALAAAMLLCVPLALALKTPKPGQTPMSTEMH